MDDFPVIAYPLLVLLAAVMGSPAWLPVAWAAYALGRRRVTIRLLLVLMTAEAGAIGLVAWLLRLNDGSMVLPVY